MTKKETKEITAREKQELTGAETTRPGRVFTPAVDIFETDNAITVLADMPGVEVDGLTIDLEENLLTIEGTVRQAGGKNENVVMREYDTGGFRREFRLTNLIDQANIDASLRDGVLRLTLPKAESAKPRKIEVRAG
jgi:HSP20 family protein